MFYQLRITLEAFHTPTQSWHVYKGGAGVRAVSRKHALNKGLKVLHSWPGYTDRANEPEWKVGGQVEIVECN